MRGWRRRTGLALLAAMLAGAAPASGAAAGTLAAGAPAAAAPDRLCAQDDGPAALRAGLAWRKGEDRARDATAAVACLERAAALQVPQAMFILSHMAAEGEGSARDPVAAQRWLARAADLDYPEALQEQAMLEQDPRRAAELLREAAHALQHRGRDAPGAAAPRARGR